jgi:hypothetical protein
LWCIGLGCGGGATLEAASIGVNLRGGDALTELDQQLPPTSTAGYAAWAQPHWNDLPLAGGQSGPLVDSNGSATTATVRWGASGAASDASAAVSTPDGVLARGHFRDGDALSAELGAGAFGAAADGFGASLRIDDVPYARYSVLLYLAAEEGATGSFGTFRVNGATAAGGAVQRFADYGGWTLDGNLVGFAGLTGPVVEIFGPVGTTTTHGSIAAVQLIDADQSAFEPRLSLEIDRETGGAVLRNRTGAAVDFAGLELLSQRGAWAPDRWRSIAQFYDQGGAVSNDAWFPFAATPYELSEATLGTGSLAHGASVDLGAGLWVQSPFETDLRIAYLDARDGEVPTREGRVAFAGSGAFAASLPTGDLNADAAINAADWLLQRDNFLADFSGLSPTAAYRRGDLNGDGRNDARDLALFKRAFEAAHGSGAFAALLAAPEPTGALWAVLPSVCGLLRRRRAGRCVAAALLALAAGGSAEAASIGVNLTDSADGGLSPRPDQTLAAEDRAGLIGLRQARWNNVPALAQPFIPVDDAGLPGRGSMTWSVVGTATAAVQDASRPDDRIAHGFWQDAPTGAAQGMTIALGGVAYARYSVLLFLAAEPTPGGSYGAYRVNGQTYEAGGAVRGYSAGPDAYGGWVPGGNVLLVENLSGSVLTIEAPPRAGNVRGTLAGFQVVEGPALRYALTLEVDAVDGAVRIVNELDDAVEIDFFQLDSAAGGLDAAGWSPLGAGTQDGSDWEIVGSPSDARLAQFHLQGSLVFAAGQAAPLGKAFRPEVFSGADGDLVFRYRAPGLDHDFVGEVRYVTATDLPGDFDRDGAVGGADLLVWQRGFGAAYGDADLAAWSAHFGQHNDLPNTAAVPEPVATPLAALAASLAAAVRRDRAAARRSG